jgi:hypothetical protein
LGAWITPLSFCTSVTRIMKAREPRSVPRGAAQSNEHPFRRERDNAPNRIALSSPATKALSNNVAINRCVRPCARTAMSKYIFAGSSRRLCRGVLDFVFARAVFALASQNRKSLPHRHIIVGIKGQGISYPNSIGT